MIDVTCVAGCGSQTIGYSRRPLRALCRLAVASRPSPPEPAVPAARNSLQSRVAPSMRTVLHPPQEDTDGREEERQEQAGREARAEGCLLYTSDAADERSSVDLGGRRII